MQSKKKKNTQGSKDAHDSKLLCGDWAIVVVATTALAPAAATAVAELEAVMQVADEALPGDRIEVAQVSDRFGAGPAAGRAAGRGGRGGQ